MYGMKTANSWVLLLPTAAIIAVVIPSILGAITAMRTSRIQQATVELTLGFVIS